METKTTIAGREITLPYYCKNGEDFYYRIFSEEQGVAVFLSEPDYKGQTTEHIGACYASSPFDAWDENLQPSTPEEFEAAYLKVESILREKAGIGVGGWISVNDRLPEYADQILVTLKYRLSEPMVICAFYENGGFKSLETMETMDNVTHWQPLPEPQPTA